jgi:hypothetical protein
MRPSRIRATRDMFVLEQLEAPSEQLLAWKLDTMQSCVDSTRNSSIPTKMVPS